MTTNDYILISRNNVVYKSQLSVISSIVCLNSQANFLTDKLSNAIDNFEEKVNVYGDSHYTKTEMKTLFATIIEVNNLTSNSKYVLTGEANKRINDTIAKEDISEKDKWYDKQAGNAAKIYINAFGGIKEIMKQEPPEEGHMVDYANAPTVEELIENSKVS